MAGTAGNPAHVANDVELTAEKQQLPSFKEDDPLDKDLVDKDEGAPSFSGRSSDGGLQAHKLDSQVVDVKEVKEGEEAYAHLPPHEREIVKRQLEIPSGTVTYRTIFRYASTYDILIIIVSIIAAIGGGAVQPLMTVSSIKRKVGGRQWLTLFEGRFRFVVWCFSTIQGWDNVSCRVFTSVVTLYHLFCIFGCWRFCLDIYVYGWFSL